MEDIIRVSESVNGVSDEELSVFLDNLLDGARKP